ncbi:E3 ubiquitin-protein ligase rnf213-beta isoform X4 [Esox lucius]|uniref:E3 ubiquitin-protein ligase rnf213-beta isoform X4 n=1 Tax=Esox lucius TaxID=8010 RepID=UPI001477080B|nr:E3 ubiquitin-protein ligase rnf213-beta isoform X4 [Esox lucius]
MELSSGEGCQGDQGSPLQRDHGHGSQDNRDPVEVTAVVGTMTKKPRTRAQQQQAEERFPRSDQDMKKKNRRRGNRRKTKNQGGFKGGDGENVLEKGKVDEMETPMNEVLQTSETQAPDQHQVQSPNPPQQPRPPDPPHPDQPKQPTHYAVPVHVKQAKKVQAHTQTRKSKGKNRATQTPRVVLTTQQTQTEPSDSTQPMAEDHTDSSQPTAEDHTDSSQAMADDHNDSSQPMAKDCPDSTQPMAEDHTVCFKPTAEDHTDSSQPTAGDHTDSSQANADDHNDSSQPMAEDCPDSSQPMGDDSTHTAVLLQNNIPGSTPLTNEQIRISDGVVNEGAALEPREEMKNKAESRKGVAPSGENQRNPTGDTPAVKGVEPGTKSYAEVAAENKRKTQKRSKELDPQTTDKKETTGSRERFPIRCPPAVPMFTFHIYAVLDKKFRFNQEHDTLLLYCGNEVFPLTIDYFIGKPQQGGYLVEASLSVEEHHIVPGQIMCYHYGVSQRQKYIIEIAKRNTKIPCDQGVKELHLYEGHINKMEGWNVTNWLKSWTKSKGTELSNAWKRSAEVLLDRVFDKFPLSYQEGSIIESLKHLHESFDSAVHRVLYPYNSTPPQIKISELISERLLLILRSEGASQKSRISSNPLLLGLSVFRVCIACGIDLGVKGWAELCHLVSSSTALGKKNIEGLQNDLPTSQFTVVGLINHLAKKTILELPLLIPLLHMLRQPGAESCRLGPTVEEGNWAGLDKVQFKTFRDNIRNVPDKRRMMLTLVQNHASVGKEMPLVWTSWLCLVAFEDILEFSTLTDAFPEHLIQSLLYRLQQLQENMENSRAKQNAEATENILCYVLKKVEEQKERLAESGVVKSVFGSCISVLQNTCKLMKLVPFYKAVVLSLQLVLKVAEIPAALPKEDVVDEESEESQVTDMLGNLQRQHLIPWRDNLLHNPILKECKSLSYPKEIEMWDAFFKVEYPLQTVSSQWRASLEKDLRKRISRASVVERVVLCCLDTSVKAIENSHDTIQTCFRDLCHSAVKTICQEGKERALLQTLSPLCNPLPSWILSSIVLGSAERFGNNPVSQLLDPESAVHHLLTQGDWKAIQVDAEAAEVLGSCQRALASLVEALCLGHVAVGHLETILKHREKFQKIYLQYRRNAKTNAVPANAEVILAQREKDLQAFKQQWEQVDTLIKMMGKVSDMITAPEIPSLKEQHRADLQSVSLSKLVEVQPCSLVQEEEQPASPGLGWWYTTSRVVLDMAREMHETRGSNLLLRSWVDRCLEVANDDLTRPIPIPMTLTQVYDIIWKPQLSRFLQLGFRIALESATFAQIDQALEASGDVGDGAQMRKELWLMSSRLLGHTELEPDWVEVRLGQIQEYRQLHQAAVLACVVLRIAERMELGGDFSEIHSLTQLEDGSFKQRALRSLSDDLIQAKQKLSSVTLQETKCLEAFLESQALVSWVQKHLQNMSDVKVFVELASISAGENDTEIDQVACFHDAVMGYGPFLYCLPPRAGFKEFMTSARQVWETLQRDQRLPDKLRDSCRLLAWLKGLRETHGSVEQSSLSLASAINAQGVYLVGWPEAHTDRQRCLQSLLVVIVRKDNEVKSYSLDNLVELQNKLMLMSSKGQHGKEQVNRFTQVFEGVQRLGHILLQMQSSGNMLFRQWKAQVQCSREKQPCIQLSFSSLRGKEIQYSGEVTEELQSLCRSMETCHMEWCALIGEKRSQFHTLNHYTSEQMVYLCKWIYSICVRRTRVPQQVWHLLSPINAGCTLKDMKEAFVLVTEKLTETQSGLPLLWNDDGDCVDDEYVSEQSEDFRSTGQNTDKRLGYNYKSTESHFEEVGDMIEFSDTEDEEETEDISPMAQRENEDNLDDLWRRFKENMPRYLTEHIDIATLARFLSCLSEMNRLWVKRKLPRALQEGKPNLILCSATEVLSTTLSFYMESPEQPLPSTDEILVCRENTSEEQVEIFLRRALGQGDGAVGSQQRIYTLVNPGLLGYDVSVGLGELFEELERTTGPNYRLVLVSPVTHQHRYVPSFFSIHKIQARVDITAERARRYLHHHFTVPSHSSVSGTYPDKLSVWVVSSARPAVGKSLYVERLFEKFQQTSPRAQYVRIRLIEPHVDLDSFIRTLSDRLALSGELDPVLLHVDTAAVNAGLEEFLFHFLVLGCLSDNKGMLWRRSLAHLMVIEVLSPRLTFQNQTHTKEVTTFSSLLTKFDVRGLAQALGVQAKTVLLLSLHQFDTEVSFCNKIRGFLQDDSQSLHILVVQVDIEESHCSDELIASAKYCTMNNLMTQNSYQSRFYVVFITKLSRIQSGGSHYIGFQGGVWLSVHIDDLRDTEDMSLNLSVFCGMPISKLLATAKSGMEPRVSIDEQAETETAHLHSLSLVRSCVQRAVGLLRDPRHVASRSMQRVHTLLELLDDSPGETGAVFQEVLLGRLAGALAVREELVHRPGDWLNREAKKRQALQEGGTLRHTLWRCLQSTLIPVLAHMVEVLDRYANLDLLSSPGLSQALKRLWLDILGDRQILDLTPPHNSSGSDQEVLLEHNLLLGEKERHCAVPFSWLIRKHFQSLWEESEFIPVATHESTQRVVQFVSIATNSKLGSLMEKLPEQERLDLGHRYLHDILLLSFRIKSEHELRVFTRAILGCVSELQVSMTTAPVLSPAWVMAAARHYAPRLETLAHTLLLQAQLAPEVLLQAKHMEPKEMTEDILALGICVEKSRLPTVTSLTECELYLGRVELLQPCLDRAFSQKYSNLCSPGCLQRLDTIRNIWCGMLVVAAFVQKVVFKMKHGVPRLVDGALKHCNLLQNLVQDGPNLRHMDTLQQLIRILNSYDQQGISTDLRSGIRCPVCLSELKEPSILPCSHVFCVTCLQCSLQADRHFCPECRQDLPPDFQPTVSQTIRSDLQQHAEIRGYCNSFFLEVVSRFCLSEGESPREGVVELLFSLLISSQGNVYRTRELTPFLECVDNSPVVRSVLPKLLLQYSFEQVKGHIQNYLWSLEENILEKEDRTELYLLLVNCFQDSLQCTRRSVVEEAKEQQRRLQDDTRFLGRLARKQTPGRREDPAGFLLSMARLRLCLGTAARLLQNESQTQGSASGSGNSVEAQYLSQVKAVCQYGGNDWYRVFLLRTINRQAGIDCLLSLMNTASPWVWAFPPEVLRLQRLLPAEVDRFLCCGPSYKAVRDGLTQALIQAHIDPLQSALQSVSGSEASAHVFLALALFRKVTSRYASPDSGLRPTTQEMSQLEDYLKIILSDKFREFCCMLLSNQIGGAGSPLHISQTVIAPRRLLLELLVHEVAVLLNGSTLLAPLLQIATQPQTMTGSYLPTMPDDHTTEAHQWLKRAGERNLKMYFCMNGHPCFVGECGRPVAVSKCPDCGVPVGGVQHNPVEGFTEAQQRIMDNTRMGHILGGAGHRTEAPERQMSLAQSCVLRLLTHLAMLQGAIRNHQAVNQMIHPGVRDVLGFLWLHLEKDVEVLGGTLDQNLDNTVVTVHLILQTCLSFTGGSHHTIPDLSSRRGREQWERLVCDEVINTVLKGLSRSLTEAQDNIGADDRLGGSPLMRLLHADPRPLLPQLPSASDCPTNHSSFWSLSENLTVERFFQRVDQEQGCKNVPLLALFLRKLQCVKQLRHLPELAALQSDLLIVCPFTADLTNQSIAQVLQQIPTGVQKKVLLGRLKVFMEVWNRLRMEVANNSADVGVSPQLCEKELTMESSGEFLSPQRHGPGSCLQILVHFLSETHNSLVTEARRLSYHDNSDFNVPLEEISETQLILCHPEKELLPLVLAHCHYTLRTGQLTDSFYDLQGIQAELARRFLAGKPRIRADMSKYLNRHHQDFSVVLDEVRAKIPQEALKGSVCTAMRTGLRSYTDVCDAVLAVEIGLRLLGKTDGDSDLPLLSYLTDSLKMGPQISCTVAKALGQSKLMHSTFTWQLLTCWKSEFMLSRGQDPFQRLPSEFQQKLSEEERKDMRVFFTGTDLATFSLELHEILLLKINQTSSNQAYLPKWDIRSTLESHLDQKRLPPLPGLDSLTENITLDKGADLWRMAVEFKKR